MNAQAYRLRPWNEVLRPHEDILTGNLEMSTYAADIGAVDRGDENVPRVYRDAREFFRTTYMTENLRQLLTDVLDVVAGGAGDRVLQLRTPFGGGKTHALLALYHLVRSRKLIDADLVGIPDPGPARAVILSGLDLDPVSPREVDGLQIRTLWGELAFRVGGHVAYEKVATHDADGRAPSGNVLRSFLEDAPVLILLDEVVVYVQRAAGRTGDDPLRRQVMVFLQTLTEVVRGLPRAAMVYSLQASVHEAAGDDMLLGELDHLVARVDAKREPVSDDEVMRVVQRRLFPAFDDDEANLTVAREAAREYAIQYARLRASYAETDAERRTAQAESERLEARIVQSYPFHPHLLDLMYHRWGSLPSYQRTRGALQFLARVVHALWTGPGPAQPLIGPGDVVLADEHVRGAFFSQVGERERYASVFSADITGPEARSREVDRRVGADSPTYERLKVGTRCATAIMLYSFGGRVGEERGVLESELVQALVTPELDRNVITTCLHDLRDELLYLHHTGRRYRFEPKPNLNLMIHETSQGFGSDEVLDQVKSQLAELLRPARDRAVLWPPDSAAIPDGEPMFRIVYLPVAEAGGSEAEYAERVVVERGRVYRNALAFAVPTRGGLERARTLARLVLALESLLRDVKARRLTMEREQVDELEERRRSAAAELKATCDRIYEQVLVPVADREGQRPFRLETIDLRAQLAAGRDLHARLLDGLRKHVFDSLTPARLVALAKLGEDREYVSAEDLAKWFFSIYDFPKLMDDSVLRDAIGRGTDGVIGYVTGAKIVDGSLEASRPELLRFGTSTRADEIDLGSGSFVLSAGLAAKLRGDDLQKGDEPVIAEPLAEDPSLKPVGVAKDGSTRYAVRLEANAAQLFRILPALQNLADRSSRFSARMEIEAEGQEPFDGDWLRNAVEEHFDEAGVDAKRT